MKKKYTIGAVLLFLLVCIITLTAYITVKTLSPNPPAIKHGETVHEELIAIRENTNTDPILTGFDNIYGIATLVVTVTTLILTLFTLIAQKSTEEHTKKTEEHAEKTEVHAKETEAHAKETEAHTKGTEAHTKNMPYKVQEGILLDMPRHQYRNLLCTLAMIKQYQESRVAHQKNPKSVLRYPSEANMLKLQTLPEQTLVKMDIEEEEAENLYRIMQETSLFFRNTNNEILAASEHFRRENLDDKSFVSDADNLLFKPLFLIDKAKALNNTFSANIKDYSKNKQDEMGVMATILAEHILKGKELSISTAELKQLSNNEFPNHLFGLPNFEKENPIQRAFKTLFKGIDFTNIKKETLIKALEDYPASVEDKSKITSFIDSIQKNENTVYGDVLNSKTEYINFWNLFKIMCYLDSTAEMDKIGMINVA